MENCAHSRLAVRFSGFASLLSSQSSSVFYRVADFDGPSSIPVARGSRQFHTRPPLGGRHRDFRSRLGAAEAIDEVPGEVLVVGHSDNTPIRSVRFPSNWHLSTARAEAVSERLSRNIQGRRLRAEGRAESEPIAPNDSAEGRARNRRVDVHVLLN